jgi:hypothetical protein
MSVHYLALRALVTGAGAYAGLTPDEAEAALNAPTMERAGSAMLAADEFVARFTPAEFVAAHASADAVVQQMLFELATRRDPMSVASERVQRGLGYMAHIGLLTVERAAEIGAVPPGATVSQAQAMGWPGGYIWAADVIAARSMEG